MKAPTCKPAMPAVDADLADMIAASSPEEHLEWAKKFRLWADQLDAINGTPPPKPKIPKGFVMLNLSESEKKEIRELAQACGAELRGVLRSALSDLKCKLREQAMIRAKTGLLPFEWYKLFGCAHHLN